MLVSLYRTFRNYKVSLTSMCHLKMDQYRLVQNLCLLETLEVRKVVRGSYLIPTQYAAYLLPFLTTSPDLKTQFLSPANGIFSAIKDSLTKPDSLSQFCHICSSVLKGSFCIYFNRERDFSFSSYI